MMGAVFSKPIIRPGQVSRVGFRVTGDTSIGMTILDAAGTRIRDLGVGDAGIGLTSRAWDGLRSTGAPVPDGVYMAALTSTDRVGQVTTAQAKITVDRTPPTVRLLNRSVVPHRSPVVLVRDATSYVQRVSVLFGSTRRGRLNHIATGFNALVPPPPRGWKPGRNALTVVATDAVGNSITKRLVFVTPRPRAPSVRKIRP